MRQGIEFAYWCIAVLTFLAVLIDEDDEGNWLVRLILAGAVGTFWLPVFSTLAIIKFLRWGRA